MRFSGRIAPADPKCALFVAAERRLVLTVSCLLCYFTATIPIDWISSAKLLHRLLDEVAWQELLFRLIGAAHQRPMSDVVMTERPKLTAPKTENRLVRFVYRQEIPREFLLEKNGEGGVVRYSNAELTAVELVQYEQYAAGLSHVATVLEELLEATDFAHASEGVFKVCKDSAIQRLGYLVEREIGDERQGEVIYHEWVRTCKVPHFVPLALHSPMSAFRRDERWKVDVNVTIERDEV